MTVIQLEESEYLNDIVIRTLKRNDMQTPYDDIFVTSESSLQWYEFQIDKNNFLVQTFKRHSPTREKQLTKTYVLISFDKCFARVQT